MNTHSLHTSYIGKTAKRSPGKGLVVLLSFLMALAGSATAWGAVGCDLNDPDRDVERRRTGADHGHA